MHITVLSTGQGLSSLVAAPFELFKYTGVLWNDLLGKKQQASFEVVTASQDGKPQLFDSNIIVKPDQKACSIEETDLVYMPGMGVEIDKMIANNPDVIKLIKNQAEKGTIVAGVCSGVAMLAEAGILDGKEATTHWALAKQFKQRFPAVNWQTDQFITQSGNIFCGGGVYGALDLCLRLIEYFAGYKIAKQSAQAFLIDSPRTWQSSYSSSLLKQTHHDEKIKQAQ
ncbi:MAG: phosphoribosylformylglycinamidine synthase subunit PurQ, partial [Gammaproteobacteria bacterium]|nr:phosphoribosylformylglycinamidine synthase subunit PurQ [Gammaproteobacteria bacterium]